MNTLKTLTAAVALLAVAGAAHAECIKTPTNSYVCTPAQAPAPASTDRSPSDATNCYGFQGQALERCLDRPKVANSKKNEPVNERGGDPAAHVGEDESAEKAFIRAIENAKNEYEAGENDMAKGASRPHRKAALCSVPHQGPRNWTGTIAKLSSNSDGKGVLKIEIAPDVTLMTWSNSLSDFEDHTLIEPDSVMYQQLVTMKKGDKVTFTGDFFPSDSDCVEETSLTQRGSMTDPAFIVRFTSVRHN